MKVMNRAVVALLFPLSVMGCGSKGSGSGDTGGAPTAARGIDAAGNDPVVVALAKKVLTCKWSDSGFAYDCADRKAWAESELTKAGKADATLVSMVEDPNEQVRWLGAQGLNDKGGVYQKDKALAERVLTAAESEKSKTVARSLGSAAGRIKLPEVGLADRAKALGKSPTMKETRLGFFDSVQYSNSEAFYAYTTEMAKTETDKDVRKAAMSSFWTGTPSSKNAEVCQLWLDLSHDDNEDFAAHAAYFAAFYPHSGGCKAQWDTLLGDVEKRAKAGTAKAYDWAAAIYYLYGQNAATPAQKKRAMAAAKLIVENKANGGSSRARALELVGDKDPGAKAYLAKFTNDPDFSVKSRANDLLKKAK